MYIMNAGDKPEGEVYLSPPTGGSTKMIMHYYNGDDVTLAEFKTKASSANPTSIEGRIRNIERHIKQVEEYLGEIYDCLKESDYVRTPASGRYNDIIDVDTDESDDRYVGTPYQLQNYDHWR